MPAVRCRRRGSADFGTADAATGMVITHSTSIAPELDHDQLARTAMRILIENWHGHATVPSRRLYPHQWSWDSAFIALGQQHIAPRRAAVELLSLFGAQWADGRLPHIAFNPAVADDAYFPGPSFWRSSHLPGHPPIDTSGIIQPPVHAIAARAVMERLGADGSDFASRAYPALVAQNSYIRERRSLNGLAAVVHPWETGLDNSQPGTSHFMPYRPISHSSSRTHAATLIMRGPASAQLMMTMRATSG